MSSVYILNRRGQCIKIFSLDWTALKAIQVFMKNKKVKKKKKEKKKNAVRICEMYYLWRFLLFCLVNSCVQIFTVPASLWCLALCSLCVAVEPWISRMQRTTNTVDTGPPVHRQPTCSFLRAVWWFFESACSAFSFFMNNGVYIILFFFFSAQRRRLLHSFLIPHQHCVFLCSFLKIWTSLGHWPWLSISLIYVIVLALSFAIARCLIGGRSRFRLWKG